MATREFVLLFVVLGLVVTVLVPHAMPQIIINTRIEGASSLPSDKLNEQLQNASLPPAGNVVSVTSSEVIVKNCGTGTYAEGNASSCSSCPAGTASNITAANSLQACQLCSSGTWAQRTAAVCSQCGVGTFSTSYGAVNVSTCRSCPVHSTSALGTTTPLNCLCADSFFFNANTIEPLDPLSSVQFAAWTSLTPDTIVLNTPHLACAPPSGMVAYGQETTTGVDTTSAAAVVTTPAAGDTTTAAGDTTTAAGETTPAAVVTTPAAVVTTPAAAVTTPAAAVTTPAAVVTTPAAVVTTTAAAQTTSVTATTTALGLGYPSGCEVMISADYNGNKVWSIGIAGGVAGSYRLIAGSGSAATTVGSGASAAFSAPMALTMSRDGQSVIVSEQNGYVLRRVFVNNGSSLVIAGSPGIAASADGALGVNRVGQVYAIMNIPGTDAYIFHDNSGQRVRKYNDTTGVVTTLKDLAFVPFGGAISPDGTTVYMGALGAVGIYKYVIATNTVTLLTSAPAVPNSAMTISPDGSKLFMALTTLNKILMLDIATLAQSFVGSGTVGTADGPMASASFTGLWLGSSITFTRDASAFYLAQSNGVIRRVDAVTYSVSTLTGTSAVSGSTVLMPTACSAPTDASVCGSCPVVSTIGPTMAVPTTTALATTTAAAMATTTALACLAGTYKPPLSVGGVAVSVSNNAQNNWLSGGFSDGWLLPGAGAYVTTLTSMGGSGTWYGYGYILYSSTLFAASLLADAAGLRSIILLNGQTGCSRPNTISYIQTAVTVVPSASYVVNTKLLIRCDGGAGAGCVYSTTGGSSFKMLWSADGTTWNEIFSLASLPLYKVMSYNSSSFTPSTTTAYIRLYGNSANIDSVSCTQDQRGNLMIASVSVISLPGVTSSSCLNCTANSYCPLGSTAPVTCPLNMNSSTGSISVQNCTCPPGFYLNGSQVCVACLPGSFCVNTVITTCPANFFCPGTSSSAPTVCAAGSYTNTAGNTQCVPCPAGSFCIGGVLAICPIGSYSPGVSASACTACPGNSTTVSVGQVAMESCACNIGFSGVIGEVNPDICGGGKCTVSGYGGAVYNPGYVIDGSCNSARTGQNGGGIAINLLQRYQITNLGVSPGYWINAPNGTGKTGCINGPSYQQYYQIVELFYTKIGDVTPIKCGWILSYPGLPNFGFWNVTTCNFDTQFIRIQNPTGDFWTVSELRIAGKVMTCSACPANSYCVQGVQTACPANSVAPAGSTSMSQCVCTDPLKWILNGACVYMISNCTAGNYDDMSGTCLPCPQGTMATDGKYECTSCPGPSNSKSNLLLATCGLIACPAATFVQLGTTGWFGLGRVEVSRAGNNIIPPSTWGTQSEMVMGMTLNASQERPVSSLRTTLGVTTGKAYAVRFKAVCTGVQCDASLSVTWVEGATTLVSVSTVNRTWHELASPYFIATSSAITLIFTSTMVTTSSGTVWIAHPTLVDLGQWAYPSLSALQLQHGVALPHRYSSDFVEYHPTVLLQMTSTYLEHNATVLPNQPYMLRLWAQGTVDARYWFNESWVAMTTATGFDTWPAWTEKAWVATPTTLLLRVRIVATGVVQIGDPQLALSQTVDAIPCANCLPNYWCHGTTINQCPLRTISTAGASVQTDCFCEAGYYGSVTVGDYTGYSPCSICPVNYYCTGGNMVTVCPDGTMSNAGSSVCGDCAENQICANGQVGTCPAHSYSPVGVNDVALCACVAGYFGTAPNCSVCEPGFYCPGGATQIACTEHAVSPPGATASPQCYCDRGFYGIENEACTQCPEASWCWTGVRNDCPVNMWSPVQSSFQLNCTCSAGYTGPDGGACSACATGTYKDHRGTDECALCDVGTSSNALAATDVSTCALCSPGHYNPNTGQETCQSCMAGKYVDGFGALECWSCVAGTWSASGAGLCTACPAGTRSTTFEAVSSDTCLTCATGYYALENSTVCSACGACPYFTWPTQIVAPFSGTLSAWATIGAGGATTRLALFGSTLVLASDGTDLYTVSLSTRVVTPVAAFTAVESSIPYKDLAVSGAFLYLVQTAAVYRVDTADYSLQHTYSAVASPLSVVEALNGESVWIGSAAGLSQVHVVLENVLQVIPPPFNSTGIALSPCLSAAHASTLFAVGALPFGFQQYHAGEWLPLDTTLDGLTKCQFTPDNQFVVLSSNTNGAWLWSATQATLQPILTSDGATGIVAGASLALVATATAGVKVQGFNVLDGSTCGTGVFSASGGLPAASSCTLCPAGGLCPGGANITACKAGTYNPATGLRLQGQCLACRVGYYCPGGPVVTVCPIGSYSLAQNVTAASNCPLCPANYYCTNSTRITQCPVNTNSQPGSSDLVQCVCNAGYRCELVPVVHAEVTLNMTAEDFAAIVQAYIAAVAAAAGVDPSQVTIVSVVDGSTISGGGRRLLHVVRSDGIEVHTNIYGATEIYAPHRALRNLDEHLMRNGLDPQLRSMRVTVHREVTRAVRISALV